VKRIGLVINPTLEQFDKFSASVEIQDHSEKARMASCLPLSFA
jgi:hypothetical protein